MKTLSDLTPEEREGLERLRGDTPLYCESCLKIVDKNAELVQFHPKLAQLKLDALLEEQRRAGKPQRAIVLKARQVGISTYTQAKLIQRCTLRANHSALVVAHDRETGGKLFAMGQRMYANLPDVKALKPDIRSFGRARFLHFAQRGSDAMGSTLYPDSTYFVDTANELEAGRGGTYHSLHLSELAFWADPHTKLTALLQGVPDKPDTLVVIESTANGHNAFKDLWDDAVAGRNEYAPFFFPWHEEPEYTRPFNSPGERRAFRIGDTTQSPYAADEPELVERYGLTPEQLNWRRYTIANKCQGQLEVFRQEYPASPEEAFIATGDHVFDPHLVRGVLAGCEKTDPPASAVSGPEARRLVVFRSENRIERITPSGDRIWLPTDSHTIPAPEGEAPFKLWLPEGVELPEPGEHYLIGVDAASGEKPEGRRETDFHAIQVINHKTREQVAEYRSRIEPMLLAEVVFLAAKWFNDAWVAVEVTGSHGLPVARRLYFDFTYPFLYTRRSHDARIERQENRIGWSTDRRTKPLMEAGGQELLREGSHGIRSRDLGNEMLVYVRNDRGKTGAEPGKHDDLLLAWLIAQQAANELPIRSVKKPKTTFAARNPVTGY